MRFALILLAVFAFAPAHAAVTSASPSTSYPTPKPDTIVLAGGCFWGVEGVFEHLKGVTNVVAGYAGGTAETARYSTVSAGESTHAESVEVTYDPKQISLEQIYKVFFTIAHDPTQKDEQGPDKGKQYRSAIFYTSPEQLKAAEKVMAELVEKKIFPKPIVTELAYAKTFYPAEDYHQDFMKKYPNQPYIVAYDKPKVEQLRKDYPQLFVER